MLWCFSMSATRRPALPYRIAAVQPATPAPAMTTSYVMTPRSGGAGTGASVPDYRIFRPRHAQYSPAMGSWPLVGRDAELDRVVAVLTGRAGPGLTVTGPAGIGKSRLL